MYALRHSAIQGTDARKTHQIFCRAIIEPRIEFVNNTAKVRHGAESDEEGCATGKQEQYRAAWRRQFLYGFQAELFFELFDGFLPSKLPDMLELDICVFRRPSFSAPFYLGTPSLWKVG